MTVRPSKMFVGQNAYNSNPVEITALTAKVAKIDKQYTASIIIYEGSIPSNNRATLPKRDLYQLPHVCSNGLV